MWPPPWGSPSGGSPPSTGWPSSGWRGTVWLGVPGTAHRLFGALGRRGVNIILISQASSERSICLAVDPADVDAARRVVGEEFALEYRIGLLDELVVEEELLHPGGGGGRGCGPSRGSPDGSSGILGGHGINIRAIAQGSSELNLSMVVAAADETGGAPGGP